MESVYLETTIPSYLTNQPSSNLVVAAHQQVTHEWWQQLGDDLELFVSEAVLAEIRAGDETMAAKRLELVKDFRVLELTEDVRALAREYFSRLGLHSGAAADILHIAFAVAYEMDYLVTWNCKHIANGHVIKQLGKINKALERTTPVIITPEELLA